MKQQATMLAALTGASLSETRRRDFCNKNIKF